MLEQNKKLLFEFMDKFEKSKLSEFEMECEDLRLSLKKAQCSTETASGSSKIESVSIDEAKIDISRKIIKSPIVGVFYGSPSPDSESFVKIGDSVKKGDVICIIEAMKMMNEITSEFDGIVNELPVNNGDLVEFGQVLAVVE